MSLLERFLGWLSERAERGRQQRAAQKIDNPHVAADALRFLVTHPAAQEVVIDSPQGRALFTRKDVQRLQSITKGAGIGERVFARAMMGGSAYGFPGGWSSDRIEMAMHLKQWVFIAITSIWQRIARIPPNVAFVQPCQQHGTQHKSADYRTRKSLQAIRPHEQIIPAGPEHPLVQLFNNPNRPDVSFDFWYELGLFLELTGNSYLWAVPSNLGVLDGTYKAAELWVLPSHWVWPRVGKNRLIEYYEVRPWIGPGMLRFPPEDLIHIRYKSPIHKIDGFSHLTAGAEWIDTQESVNRSRFYQFKNGCFPLGNLKLGPQYADLDDEDLERLYGKLFARFQGEANFGRPIITPPDSEYVPLTINPTEMAYNQTADQLRDMILALWRVPKEVAGIQDAGSEIAMYGPLRQFAENCLIPRLTYLGQVLTEKLASRWDRRLRVWWDDPAGEDPKQVNEDIKTDADCGAITPNEIRTLRGRDPLPDGDKPVDSKPAAPPPSPPGLGAPRLPGKTHTNGHLTNGVRRV